MNGSSLADQRSQDPLPAVLNPPLKQPAREYKYRCAQAIVFGLPVVALQYFGKSLGGPEAERWVAILQALLAGWVMYVGAAGMLFEGILRLRHQITSDLVVSLVAIGFYLFSFVSMIAFLFGNSSRPLFFHGSVIVIAVWAGIQWFRAGSRLQP